MPDLLNKSNQSLTHSITDNSQENITTYSWKSIWSHHSCPCCSYGLLRHISHGDIYWRCSHCYQTMPVWDISKSRSSLATSAPLHEFQDKHPYEIW